MNDLMTKSFLNYVELKKQTEIDLEAGEGYLKRGRIPPAEPPDLSVFFGEVEVIKSEMEGINALLFDLQNLNEETKSRRSAKALCWLRDRVDSDITAVLRKARVVKSRLELLERSNANHRRVFGEGGAVDRTRVSVTNGLRARLKDIMNGFRILRNQIISKQQGEIQDNRAVEKTDMEIGDRNEAMMAIERSLNNLHRVFLDMAVLVEAQGGTIDDIEHNVASAGGFVNGGTNSLFYAKQRKKQGREWVYWVSAVGLIVVIVCFISMLSS
ncbi:hypothetical protein NMG60_11026212 [Bertholletia excelsa]